MKHVRDRIQAYCDGELAPAQREAVETHLRECPACRRELASTRRLWAEVEAAGRPEAAGRVWPGVAARLARRERPAPWTWTQRGLAAAAVVAGLAIGLGLGGGRVTDAASRGASSASAAYLEESLPTLDEAWLQLSASASEEAGS